jgi:uncharacterized protein (DUF849 family)
VLDVPLIVNLAPTGAVADRNKNSHIPIDEEAIVLDVGLAARLGATIVHLHVRDDHARPSSDPRLFANIIRRLRGQESTRDLILCASTSGRHGQTREERAAVINLPEDVRPEMASLTLGSLNFPDGASVNDPDTIRYLLDEMNRNRVKPELEIFDIGMIEFAKRLVKEGSLTAPYYFNIILGNMFGFRADVHHLSFALSSLPENSIVSVGGIGRAQRDALALGVAAANGVRVGLEDNLWSNWTTREPASNQGLMASVAALASSLDRPIATASQARLCLGLPAAARPAG